MIKAAFLLQYRRVFPLPQFQTLCTIFLVFICAFGISQVVTVCLTCVPFQSLFDPSIPGKCISVLDWWLIGSSISLVTDVAILVMPIPLLKTLPLAMKQKLVLMATFGLGILTFSTCAISVVRITTLRQSSTSDDGTYDSVIAGIWSITELSCAIVCVCVPTLRPLLGWQSPRPRFRGYIEPNIDRSSDTELFTQSDAGTTSQKRPSKTFSRTVSSGDVDEETPSSQTDPQNQHQSNPGNRRGRKFDHPRIDLGDIPGLAAPPAVHTTPYHDSPKRVAERDMNHMTLPLTRVDTEEGVGFLSIEGPEPELPTPLKPPPRRHTDKCSSQEEPEYFGAVEWDESGQPRASRPSEPKPRGNVINAYTLGSPLRSFFRV
ncbi:hypothetical protein CCHL11_07044 [Colletotrichum chlorophyti]|uniref:Rhodopsin domain-containing protein n=1 Tax=Colletotrichum chlorophyti TaxID=708187 RepID=A0A1Q8RCM8_9PEZI|nr:hypothetical protein CCHL11_07044 [Colletotrichum chlorophyti]